MYDAQLGRFHTQDRYAEKYLDFTPYQYGANNPIKFIDVNGDSLILTGAGANDAVTIANKASGGYYNTTRDAKTGLVSYTRTDKKGDITKEQQGFIDNFSSVTDLAVGAVKIEVVKSSEDVPIGDFANGKIDIDDIKQFGDGPLLTEQGALIHEVTEQAAKQLNGLPFNQTPTSLGAHDNIANNSENAVNGTTKGDFIPRVAGDPTKPHVQTGSWTQKVHHAGEIKNATIMINRNNVTKVYQ